jgi:hypothetical protein
MHQAPGGGRAEVYRLVWVRFWCESPGVFSLQGLAKEDAGMLPRCNDRLLHSLRFRAGQLVELRFLVSSRSKEVGLSWTGLGKGKLQRFAVEVTPLRRAELTRTITLLDGMSLLDGYSARHPPAKDASGGTSVAVLRRPSELDEAQLYFAVHQPGAFMGSTSARTLRTLKPPVSELQCLVDALFPLVFLFPAHVMIPYALDRFPDAVDSLRKLSFPALALGMGLINMALSTSLQSATFRCVKVYAALARFDLVVGVFKYWWCLGLFAQALVACFMTAVIALSAKVLALQGGLPLNWALQVYLGLDDSMADKLLLLAGAWVWGVGMVVAASWLHLYFGSNQDLCIWTVLLLERIGFFRPEAVSPTCLISGLARARGQTQDSLAATGGVNSPKPVKSNGVAAVAVAESLLSSSQLMDKDRSSTRPVTKAVPVGLKSSGLEDEDDDDDMNGSATGGGVVSGAKALGLAFGKPVEPEWGKEMSSLDRPMRKEGLVRCVSR